MLMSDNVQPLNPQFELEQDPTPPPKPQTNHVLNLLLLALKALSQRALIALASLFTLLTVGSVFWLCLTLPEPNLYHLIQIAMYALFVLAANYLVLRRRAQ